MKLTQSLLHCLAMGQELDAIHEFSTQEILSCVDIVDVGIRLGHLGKVLFIFQGSKVKLFKCRYVSNDMVDFSEDELFLRYAHSSSNGIAKIVLLLEAEVRRRKLCQQSKVYAERMFSSEEEREMYLLITQVTIPYLTENIVLKLYGFADPVNDTIAAMAKHI